LCKDPIYCEARDVDAKKESEMRRDVRDEKTANSKKSGKGETRRGEGGGGKKVGKVKRLGLVIGLWDGDYWMLVDPRNGSPLTRTLIDLDLVT
jgi:hypothetical protein